MKNSVIIGILCLGIGFGAALLLKPGEKADETTGNTPPAGKSAPAAPSKGSSAAPEGLPAKSERKPEDPEVAVTEENAGPDREAMREQFRQGRDRWRDMMTTRQKAKEEAQIAKLIDRLGLSGAQADQLRAYFEQNRADLAAMMEGGDRDWSKIKEFTAKMRGDGLDDELAKILTDDQQGTYTEMQQRDRANQIEARAYKDLAKIQGVLDLTQEQKDQVYEVLYEDAETKIDSNQDANTVVSMFTQGLGINIDPDDLGISSAIQVQIDQASTGEEPPTDPNAIMETMRQGRQNQIDQQVERLAPILDETQEEAYRTHLESQGTGLLGGLLQGGNVDVQSLQIPNPAPTPDPNK